MSHHLNESLSYMMIGGGLLGYLKQKSIPSLVGGLSIGLLFKLSSYWIQEGRYEQGHGLAASVSLATQGLMGQRYLKTRKIMPAGLIAAFASIGFGYNAYKYVKFAKPFDK
jgi:uncharacterized membrane protein (UPF0136 family)